MGFLGSNFFIESFGKNSFILPYASGVVAMISCSKTTTDLFKEVVSKLPTEHSFCIHRTLAIIAEKKSDWQEERIQLIHINMLNADADLFILNAPQVLYKTRTGQIEPFGNPQTTLSATSTVADSIALGSFASLFLTLDPRLITVVENHLPFLFSKKEIKKIVEEFTGELEAENSIFLFINNEINSNKQISKRDTIKASLNEIISYEETLDKFIEEHFPEDIVASTNSALIFNELIINALEHGALGITRDEKQKAMQEGNYEEFIAQKESQRDGKIEIAVDLYKSGVARFSIKDSGKGFDFSQYINSVVGSERFHGRGVMMSRQSALAFFYSDRGRKVTFFMRFERGEDLVEDLLDGENLLREMTILYAEDDNFVRTHIAHVLKRIAKGVFLAKDGKEAVQLFEKYRPDIVVSDVEMPFLNGLDLAIEVRKISKDTPILITTAYNTDEFFGKAHAVGVDKFLSKPISVSTLREVLYGFARNIYTKEFTLKQLAKNAAK